MRLEPRLCRAKFEREIALLGRQRDVLRTWGAWVADATYPAVDVVFVPRKPMRLTLPVAQMSLIVQPHPANALATLELPVLSARAFGARISLDDFDQRAPSVTFRDPWTWEVLGPDRIPLGQTIDEYGKNQLVVLNDHPETHRPFLCIRGTREYHEHPQHTGDDWALYRGDIGLFTVVSTVWRTCVDLARPNVIFAGPGNIQLQWEAEGAKP